MDIKNIKLLILSTVICLVFGCDEAISCLIPKEPQLSNTQFPIGTVDVYYYAEISAEINNEPLDNNYNYYFEVPNQLPPGLDYYINHRTISIEGTPTQEGIYDIDIELFVEGIYEEDDLNLCSNFISKTYTVIIE